MSNIDPARLHAAAEAVIRYGCASLTKTATAAKTTPAGAEQILDQLHTLGIVGPRPSHRGVERAVNYQPLGIDATVAWAQQRIDRQYGTN